MNTNNSGLQVTGGLQISESARGYALGSRSSNTRLAYRKALAKFTTWAELQGVAPLPAQVVTVVEYLTALADEGASLSGVEMARAAIGSAHRALRVDDPTRSEDVKLVMAGITRKIGAPPHKKSPLRIDDLRRMAELQPDSLLGVRNRALLLIGFSGAFRRSELVGLDVEDITFRPEKISLLIRRSKTDQAGQGQTKVIPAIPDPALNPVLALRTWLELAHLTRGAVFCQIDRWDNLRPRRLQPQAVATVVKNSARLAGLDPGLFAGHSLRSGFITEAAEANMPTWAIREQTGHRSDTILQGYIQDSGRGAERAVRAVFGHTPKTP